MKPTPYSSRTLRGLSRQLRERIKELECLNRVSFILGKTDLPLEQIVREVAEAIPSGLQFTEVAAARILLDGIEHATPRFQPGEQRLGADILVDGQALGRVEVCYLEPRPAAQEGPFLQEERALVEQVAQRLAQLTIARRAVQTLQQTEQRFNFALDAAGLAAWSVDSETGHFWHSSLYPQLFGYQRPVEWSIERAMEHVLPEDRAKLQAVAELPPQSPPHWRETFRIRRRDGRIRWVCSWGTTRFDEAGTPREIYGISQDITEQRARDEHLQLASNALNSTAEGLLILDLDCRVVMVNEAYCKITGYDREAVLGRNPSGDLSAGETLIDAINSRPFREEGMLQGETLLRRADGNVFPAFASISAVRDAGHATSHYLVVIRDITDYKEVEGKLHHQFHHDALTGLPNRVLLRDRGEAAVRRARRHHHHAALLFLDVDRFKQINDSFGHEAGDAILQEIAERLGEALHESDTLARLGGDEFAVLLDELETPEEAGVMAQSLLESLVPPFVVDGQEIRVSASIGITCFPNDADSFEELMHHADQSVFRAKDEGRNNYQFYAEQLHINTSRTLTVQAALHRALEREELQLHYQPIVDLATRRITGLEALIRWHSEELGPMAPDDFIPVAEETGLILPIGNWVLDTALAQLAVLHQQGHQALRICVNLSPRQFRHSGLLDHVTGCLERHRIPPQRLDLEITESTVMQRMTETLETLESLRRLGVGMTLDDFGTGYCSLQYLKDFRVKCLKIDKSFVAGIPYDEDNVAIVSTILAIARGMDIAVVAEGVETREQLSALRGWGCEEAQGFYLSRPLPFADLRKLLDSTDSLILPDSALRNGE